MAGDAVNTAAEPLDLADMQGLLVRGYGQLPRAGYLLLHVTHPPAARLIIGRWAGQLTTADRAPRSSARNLAFTAAGIGALRGAGLPEGFSEQFRSGMTASTRSRMLGDVGADDPSGWTWGGPHTTAVHVMLMIFAESSAALSALVTSHLDDASAHGLQLVAHLPTDNLGPREHFGFHDGISQPLMAGLPLAGAGGDVVRAGEFVLGYVNEYGQRTERPLLPRNADPAHLLPLDADGSGSADLGRNGSYLAFRQLRQDVEAFNRYLDEQSRTQDGSVDLPARNLLAARIVGRWPSGAPLTLSPALEDPRLADSNNFSYHHQDRLGAGCPMGAHIRRTNPRDSLPPSPGTMKSVAVNRRHRLLRRGRNYSGSTEDQSPYEATERGIHFISLNANLSRQYEFIQHSWVNDPSFNGLTGATDPLIGPRPAGADTFTVAAMPLRRRYRELPQFVRVRGGAYFFLPGLRAIHYLLTER